MNIIEQINEQLSKVPPAAREHSLIYLRHEEFQELKNSGSDALSYASDEVVYLRHPFAGSNHVLPIKHVDKLHPPVIVGYESEKDQSQIIFTPDPFAAGSRPEVKQT